jgi:NitT/TauT family transport system permease protein
VSPGAPPGTGKSAPPETRPGPAGAPGPVAAAIASPGWADAGRRGPAVTLGARFAWAVGAIAAALAIWQVAVTLAHVPVYYIPAPSDIATALWNGRSLYPVHFAYTMYATLAGFGIALVLGLLLAMLVSEVWLLERTVFPLLVAGQSMPRIALAPIVIVWFGFGLTSKIVLAAFSAFFPVLLNMVHGLATTNQDQIALLRSLRATRAQILWHVKLPNALPFLLAGANVSVIFSMLATIVAEFLGANRGMGFLIVQESNNLDTAGVFATIFVLSLAGLVFHYGIQLVRSRVLDWAAESELGGSQT